MPRAPRFDVEPFQPDGGVPPAGFLLLVGGVLATAAFLGFLLAVAVESFYLVVLFPIIAGALLGGAGRGLVRAGRIRSPAVAGTVAAVAGLAMMFLMHYFCYIHDLYNAGLVGAPPINVFQYINLEAHEGVLIGENGANGINLGYVGSYIYFAFETLLAVGFAVGLAYGPAAEPFCRSCNRWKQGRTLAALPHVPQRVAVDAVEVGALLDLLDTGVPIGGGNNNQFLKVFACPQCGGAGTVAAAVEQITMDSRGRGRTKLLGRSVYPGEVLALIEEYSPWRRPPAASEAAPRDVDDRPSELRRDDVRLE